MANRIRIAWFKAAVALKLIRQAQSDDVNRSIDGDTSESYNDDHISKMSDHISKMSDNHKNAGYFNLL